MIDPNKESFVPYERFVAKLCASLWAWLGAACGSRTHDLQIHNLAL